MSRNGSVHATSSHSGSSEQGWARAGLEWNTVAVENECVEGELRDVLVVDSEWLRSVGDVGEFKQKMERERGRGRAKQAGEARQHDIRQCGISGPCSGRDQQALETTRGARERERRAAATEASSEAHRAFHRAPAAAASCTQCTAACPHEIPGCAARTETLGERVADKDKRNPYFFFFFAPRSRQALKIPGAGTDCRWLRMRCLQQRQRRSGKRRKEGKAPTRKRESSSLSVFFFLSLSSPSLLICGLLSSAGTQAHTPSRAILMR